MARVTCQDAARDSSSPSADPPRPPLSVYASLLNWTFAVFSSTRLLTYLPTLWAIHASGDSTQHSLLTWLAWVGSNASMAAWLYENNGRRVNQAIAVTARNAVMCLAAFAGLPTTAAADLPTLPAAFPKPRSAAVRHLQSAGEGLLRCPSPLRKSCPRVG